MPRSYASSSSVASSGRATLSPIPGPEAHGQGRRGREAGEEHEPEDDEPSDTAAHRRPDRDRTADDRQGDGERHGQRDVVDVGHGEETEETRGRQERAEHRQEERRSLGARRRRRRARRARRPGSGHGGLACIGVGDDLRLAVALAVRDLPPDERGADEYRAQPERALVRPQIGLGDDDQAADSQQPETDQEPRLVAPSAQCLDRDRVLARLVGDDEPGGAVEQDPRAAGEGERRERDAVDERVDVEVAAEPGGHAAEPAALVGSRQPSGRRLVEGDRRVGRVAHGEPPWMIPHSVRSGAPAHHPADP